MIAHFGCPSPIAWRHERRICLNACCLGRRLKIIPNAFGEKAALKLMFAAMSRGAERWRAVRWTPSGTDSTRITRPKTASNEAPQQQTSGPTIQHSPDSTVGAG